MINVAVSTDRAMLDNQIGIGFDLFSSVVEWSSGWTVLPHACDTDDTGYGKGGKCSDLFIF